MFSVVRLHSINEKFLSDHISIRCLFKTMTFFVLLEKLSTPQMAYNKNIRQMLYHDLLNKLKHIHLNQIC